STERPKTNGHYDALVETYATNKTFRLYTTGNPTGSTVTYQLKTGSPSDVISVDPNGQVTILNASMNNQIGKVIVEATSHDPNGNYSDKTIELPINIEKGTRTIAFAEHPINVLNGTGSVVPSILVEGVLDTEGNTTIEIDPSADSSIAWTNDGATIQYSWSGADGKDIRIHVTKPANRNYKIAEADGTLHILGADESALTLSTPGKITYGDHFTIRSTQDESMSSNVQYTFETDNQVFVSVPQVNGNKAEFDAIGYSGSTEISVKVTRSADGELPLTKTVKIKVLPKPITIEIENKDRLRLEENPPLTYKDFKPQLVTWNGVQDTIDESVIRLSTSAVKFSPIGTYPIIAKNVQKQLNDNYPNYIFTIKEGLLNVKDNGDKNFWDVDDDGCPDLNIEIEDDEGNTILINGDKNEDGIPDYNIDKDGDGIPDLNIDTDEDGKPDLNLVILKEWKPSKCITLGDIQFSSGVNAKAEINIDLNNDGIPDINIDTNGDFKADFNIDTDNDGEANVNIGTIHSQWRPDHDYKVQNFAYDSIAKAEPLLNIDTDGDGRPDLNLDLDKDGVADLNIDLNGDGIPDVNIDGDGDGKPEYNLDPDEDGNPTNNVIQLDEWKPEHNVDNPFAYDTMKIEDQKELEDNGISVEKPDGSTFPPNIELKVTDVTVNQKADVINGMGESLLSQQEVKQVFEIKLLENGKEIQPDGTLKIRIPFTEAMVNAILVKQNKDGTYEKLNVSIENGYLVYESDELGIVAIIADKSDPQKEVEGSYYPGANTGGALTGDTSNPLLYVGIGFSSLGLLFYLLYKHKKEENI
ncbi:MAG: hypothetical protein HFE67_08910, partial [Erysipelotrichaceae bacterium]|nr:hypothetical protein [Erysipelotrichaceae bacterium]